MAEGKLKKYIIGVWIVVIAPVIFLIVFLFMLGNGWLGYMPTFEELENPKSNLASEVYSSDQKLLGKYYIENRSNVNFSNLSSNIVNALIATEDARFFKHSGVDGRALLRVVAKPILGSGGGGGSTITQQLAKNLFPRERMNKVEFIMRKFKEWVIAIKLEKNYTKDEIIAMYLNTVDFGHNSFGIKSAAKTYFNTSPDSLKVQEAAMLVGLLKAPTYYSPIKNPENAMRRRNTVLGQMKKYNYLTVSQFDSLKVLPIKIDYSLEDHTSGLATYFREYIRDELKEWCKHHKKADGSNYDIYKDGLKVYTTINSRMQRHAEEAVQEWIGQELQPKFFSHWKGKKTAPFYQLNEKEVTDLMNQSMKQSERYRIEKQSGFDEAEITAHFNQKIQMKVFGWNGDKDTLLSPMDSMRYYKHFLQTGFMAVDPTTGYVKAWVGGINYKHFKYDHVRSGMRQVGSTFKPFVYALAMQEGYSPCYQVPNIPVTFELPEGGTWSPKNSDGKYGGMMSLKVGLATSTNTVTAYVLKQFGPEAVVAMARKCGITSPMDAVPSICLGTPDVSVYEMVGANATFANKGVHIDPQYITRIEDKNGNVLEEFVSKKTEALDEQTAYLVVNLMKGVVDRGTGQRLRFRYKLTQPIAGKTGTTQNNSDGWFMGITPELVAGCWVGCEDRSAHFRSTDMGQGATMALPIYAKFMQKVNADKNLKISQGDFEKPKGDISVELDCAKYNREHGLHDDVKGDVNTEDKDPFDL